MNNLQFKQLRAANILRIPLFKNSKGVVCHNEDGSDWSPAQWLQALIGEMGEYANGRKKFERGDWTQEEFDAYAKKEIADMQIYLDILAFRLGIDLGAAVMDKFNEVSRRVGVEIFLTDGPTPAEEKQINQDAETEWALRKLNALEAAGVDNWDGYDDAMATLEDGE